MSLPRDLTAAVRRLDEAELRRVAILVRGLLLASDGPALELEDLPGLPQVTYTQQYRACGRDCASCPHGPYWYATWREGGTKRSLYIGAELAGNTAAAVAALSREDLEELAAPSTVTTLHPPAEQSPDRGVGD